MDRGDLQATVHGVTRIRHDLATKITTPLKNRIVSLMLYVSKHNNKIK